MTNRELLTYGSVGGGGRKPAPYPAPHCTAKAPLIRSLIETLRAQVMRPTAFKETAELNLPSMRIVS